MCPELIASLLFTEKLDDLECLVVTGHEQFSTYTGYARNFRFGGNFMDPTQVENNKRKSYLVAIDALCFGRYGQMGDIGDKLVQYAKSSIDRELNKAYVGFYSKEE